MSSKAISLKGKIKNYAKNHNIIDLCRLLVL